MCCGGNAGPIIAHADQLFATLLNLNRDRTRVRVQRILDQLFAIAERQGRLRSDVDRRVVDALFLEMLTRLVTHSSLRSTGLTPTEIYRSIANLLIHGMLAPPSQDRAEQ